MKTVIIVFKNNVVEISDTNPENAEILTFLCEFLKIEKSEVIFFGKVKSFSLPKQIDSKVVIIFN
jgi:hypothetical protein